MADSQAGDGLKEIAAHCVDLYVSSRASHPKFGTIKRSFATVIRLTFEATRQVDSSHLHDWLECRMGKPLQATTESDVAARLRELIGERQQKEAKDV